MSATASGQVIYGFGIDRELLRVQNGTMFACRLNYQHEVLQNKPFCPCCGSRVEEVPKMDYSEVLWGYARKRAWSADQAFEHLSKYQWKEPEKLWHPDRSHTRMWIFGALVSEGGSNSSTSFIPMGFDRTDIDFQALIEMFMELGFNPEAAKYFLLVELS